MPIFANSYKFAKYNNGIFTLIKIVLIIVTIILVSFSFHSGNKTNVRVNKSLLLESNIEEEIEDNIDTQLGDLDFTKLDNIISNLPQDTNKFIGTNSFVQIVKKFLNAEDSAFYENFFSYAIAVIFDNILSCVPYFAIIIVLAISFSLIGQFSSDKNKSLSNLIHIIFFSAIAVIVLKIVLGLLVDTRGVVDGMEGQIEIIFPILLTLITAIGGSATASTFQPVLAVLSTGIAKLFNYILIPIFIFSIIFGVVGNLSKNVKLDKFSKFFSSLFNWIIGIVFTVFIAFLTIHGLTVSSIDSISFKTAKFAIKSYVPMLGGYLSDGINVIIASSVLIKNAVGVSGLVVMIGTIFAPIIKIIVIILLLKLTSAILEPICDKEIPDFLFSISKALNMLTVSIIAIGLMYLITTSLLMSCSNLI